MKKLFPIIFLLTFILLFNFHSFCEEENEFEKYIGVLDIKDELERLNKITDNIMKATGDNKINPEVKILNTTDINAFAYSEKIIYVTKGLLDNVQSDDELAAVLAHEIAHLTCHHQMKLRKKVNKTTFQTLLGSILAYTLAKTGGVQGDLESVFPVFMAAGQDNISSYQRKDEREADRYSILYLKNTKYNPVGVLTFMERLLLEAKRRPWLSSMGIFQTHPDPEDRIRYIILDLNNLGIPINRMEVSDIARAEIDFLKGNSEEIPQIFVRERLIFTVGSEAENKSKKERAEYYIKLINNALNMGLRTGDLQIFKEKSRINILAKGNRIISIYPSDANFQKKSMDEIAKFALENLQKEIFKDFLNSIY